MHGRKSGCKEFADHDRHAGVVCLQNDWLMQGDGNVFSSIDDMEKFLCGLRGDALLKPKSKVRYSALSLAHESDDDDDDDVYIRSSKPMLTSPFFVGRLT